MPASNLRPTYRVLFDGEDIGTEFTSAPKAHERRAAIANFFHGHSVRVIMVAPKGAL